MQNAIYAQSGGVTAVINATASQLIKSSRNAVQIGKMLVAHNGILGILHEELWNTAHLTPRDLELLAHTPGGAFGSCRYKLKHEAEYARILEVFKAHNIGYFFYNGGGDSQDTTYKIFKFAQQQQWPLKCIGIPKTIDNDLYGTDNCPGFGSAAKYIAISTLEASYDLASMANSSTKVFILEVMGRHTGWLAASSILANSAELPTPHIVLLPERPFITQHFLNKVKECVARSGFCVIVAAEGLKDPAQQFVSALETKDAFGHAQLGGVAPYLANLVQKELNFKTHFAIADYLQRAASHIVSRTDWEQASRLGQKAIEMAENANGSMLTIRRLNQEGQDYQWDIGSIPLAEVANREKLLPDSFITADGMGITEQGRQYLAPLIAGESYPSYIGGIPEYIRITANLREKKLSKHLAISQVKLPSYT